MKTSILAWVVGISLSASASVAMADNTRIHNNHQSNAKSSKSITVKKVSRQIKPANAQYKKTVIKHVTVKKPINGTTRKVKYNATRQPVFANKKFIGMVKQRQNNQQSRIRTGIRKGQLVRFEVRDLQQQQQRITQRLHQIKSDRTITARERMRMTQMLNKADLNIQQKRQNRIMNNRARFSPKNGINNSRKF